MKRHLKIVIAPDSFKGSISAQDAAKAIADGLKAGAADNMVLETVCVPIADGGEGTLDALVKKEDRVCVRVTGAGGQAVDAEYGHISSNTAVIEMARAAGLTLVSEQERNAAMATTYGVGQLILHALDCGYRHILLTVGGSGSNDGGCGMLAALGAKFQDLDQKSFVPTGINLEKIAKIDLSSLDPRLAQTKFTVATDVKNPLCGKNGATMVYAKQKGADDPMLAHMERGMLHYAKLLHTYCGKEIGGIEGCGAGGGLPAPLLAFTQAELRSGISAVLDAVGFDESLRYADLVITGEGKIDGQSLFGKAISGVSDRARQKNVRVICFAGCVGEDLAPLPKLGLHEIYTLADISPSIEYSIQHADELLYRLAKKYMQSYRD